ncbi:MAG: cytochrome c biogenesis protein CcsA [Bacteroidetes bacterium]|nr:cytochrome c biogenesis protein CcsA [Bacteroidota bacterium]
MTWLSFPLYAYLTSTLWLVGILFLLFVQSKKYSWFSAVFLILGIGGLACFTINLWISLERPPFRTLAETRLWYSIFLSVIGIIVYYRWKLFWMLAYTLSLAVLFMFINVMNPDTFDKTLMPALQSLWFIPHVVVYIIAYAFLAVSSLTGMKGLVLKYKGYSVEEIIKLADNTIYLGFAFLTFGLLFGALWAKEAWGHYWSWDPKETWAFLTWMVYLIYIHFRINKKTMVKQSLWILSLAFIVLLICWLGINYLPAAQESIHVYSN